MLVTEILDDFVLLFCVKIICFLCVITNVFMRVSSNADVCTATVQTVIVSGLFLASVGK
jgi:hypothetical protein